MHITTGENYLILVGKHTASSFDDFKIVNVSDTDFIIALYLKGDFTGTNVNAAYSNKFLNQIEVHKKWLHSQKKLKKS